MTTITNDKSVPRLRETYEVEQILGKALGFPRYVERPDSPSFGNPYGEDAEDEVCVGEHTVITLAEQAAQEIRRLRGQLQVNLRSMEDLQKILLVVITDCERALQYYRADAPREAVRLIDDALRTCQQAKEEAQRITEIPQKQKEF